MWSGRPNPQLVAEAAACSPGRALDVGSGEGADAVWLAEQGWQVTGLDISDARSSGAAEHADRAGVGDRVESRHADLRDWTPGEGAYDLVSAQFMHLPDGGMVVFTRLAAAVAPGGTLLIVGHHPGDLDTGLRWSIGGALFTPEELRPRSTTTDWDIATEVRERRHRGRRATRRGPRLGPPGPPPLAVHPPSRRGCTPGASLAGRTPSPVEVGSM